MRSVVAFKNLHPFDDRQVRFAALKQSPLVWALFVLWKRKLERIFDEPSEAHKLSEPD